MSENVFDRVNDYGSVKITLASPNDIRSWSFGEVKRPETINYRTYRPEKDGLFCERIFGPERDYECACGKYKGTKYKGIICDRCGVKVTHSRVRRKRMGHINLAAPIVHIWFFKAMPSRLGNLLDMKTGDLEKIIYFQDYVVTDPGDTELTPRQVLTEDEYREAREKFGASAFTAMMGAEAIRELLDQLDLTEIAFQLRDDLDKTRSKQKKKDLSKRLKIVEQIRGSENDPTWMVLDVVPVIPPDLRPLVLLESGNFATSDLNDLYRRIINRNNRLKKLMDLNAPEVIIRNEKRMLQQSVDALFDNGRCRRPVLGSSNRPLKSLTDMIKGKQGRFRENLLGKRVDYSARSVIVVGPTLKLHQCGLPKKIALELFQPFIIRKLKEHGLVDTIKSAKKMLERRDPEVWDVLEEVIHQHPVLLNRAPTLHRMGIQAFEPVLVEGNAIRIHPLVCGGFNADFDGDQMAVHLPLSVEAQAEASVLMLSPHNIFSPANGSPIISPSQDIVLGVYYITVQPEPLADEVIAAAQGTASKEDLSDAVKAQLSAMPEFKDNAEALMAYDMKKIGVHTPIVLRLPKGRFSGIVHAERGDVETLPESGRIVTTVGRLTFNDILEEGMPYYNCSLGKKGASRVIDDTYAYRGRPATIGLLDAMKAIGFERSTTSGLSFGITDLRIPEKKQELIATTQKKVDRIEKAFNAGALTERERYNQLLDEWTTCREAVKDQLLEELKNDRRDDEGNLLPIDRESGI
ncbi:MAG: DNA-directed RNA polymerase subunit beta', partial [Planctomycetia bacterium]|nr:DNA-directed RNA polymerase subunit beta' [Planctomycetia bacterium]